MLETITAVNQAVNSFIWGIPAMVCIIGVGLLLSVRTGFLQLRKFPYAIKTTIGRIFRKKDASDGAMTPFQAVCTALAATVGTGNIAGVAGAIAIGGPGAVFWMWCSALLGMCTKFSEVTLDQPHSAYHRVHKVALLSVKRVNGQGKSTLIRIISGAERPDSGTVTRKGQKAYTTSMTILSM